MDQILIIFFQNKYFHFIVKINLFNCRTFILHTMIIFFFIPIFFVLFLLPFSYIYEFKFLTPNLSSKLTYKLRIRNKLFSSHKIYPKFSTNH